MKVSENFQLKNTAAVLFAGALLCIFVQLNVSEIQIEILKASVKPAHQTQYETRMYEQQKPEKNVEAKDTATVAIMTTVTASTETNERLAIQEKLEFYSQRSANGTEGEDMFPELHIEELEEEIDPTELPTEASPIKNSLALSCPNFTIPWEEYIVPKINLRNDHFLTAAFMYGPNNQLRGFRETVMLSIILNRTLIIPPFFKHNRNDKLAVQEPIAKPSLRVDISALRSLIPVVDGHDVAHHCDFAFDAVFMAGKSYCKDGKLKSVADFTGFFKFGQLQVQKVGGKHDCAVRVPTFPVGVDSIKKPLRYAQNHTKIAQLYESDAKCPLWMFPYRTIDFDR